ncbi:MGMT family protein [Rossellomorea marisflavi]|uniref:MGMT family protein n=1 Tax=Rossellomorea marisflavi TaxID=189381 RepID=UPI0020422AFF|nr:MGMT family protein [Rossellomorea marisflavi]MCM2591645.1 MGMT family protein [Rossellomorea marisflavi]
MKPFTQRAVSIIKSIPKGRVMTYGQVAAHAGSPRGARQVVRMLHSMSAKHGLPWHRVLNGKGEISLGGEEGQHQMDALRQEGILFQNGTVNLDHYHYEPLPFEEE